MAQECCVELDNITASCGAPPKAGIKLTLAVACGGNLKSFPTPVNNVYPTKPVLEDGKKWNTIQFSKENLKAPVSKVNHKGKTETKFSIWIPQITAARSYILQQMVGTDKIVTFQDHHDNTRVLGEVDTSWARTINGCTVDVTEDYEKNGYTVEFSYEDGDGLPMFLSAAAVTAMKDDFKVTPVP